MARIAKKTQISVHLPNEVYVQLRKDCFELHKPMTKIVIEALVLYHNLVQRQKAAAVEEASVDG